MPEALRSQEEALVEDEETRSEYIISSEDLLEISVYGEADLNTEARVTREGTINYPLLGTIKASGLTARQLEKNITELLEKDYLVSPQVTVAIKEYGKVSIIGEVKIPGSYQMKERLTLAQAIALAGGFTDEADLSRIKVIRTSGAKKETIIVDLDKILNKKALDFDVTAKDTIIVSDFGSFSIGGLVAKPGVYKLRKNFTVVDAISLAGGFGATAAPNGTKVIRIENGEKKVIIVPVARILRGDANSKDVILKPEDTVVVPESFF
jgi:polysaccharide biosynthesis/export protein